MFDRLALHALINGNHEIDLEILCGKHKISGVSQNEYSNQDGNSMTLTIDGVNFTFIENPDDGYRSTFDKVIIGVVIPSTTFSPVKVDIRYIDDTFYGLEIYHNNKLLAQIGTDHGDSWYPWCVLTWNPEVMGTWK